MMGLRRVAHFQSGICVRGVRLVGGVEDPPRTAGTELGSDLTLDLRRHKVMMSLNDLTQKGGTDRVDEVGAENAAGQKIHRIVFPGLFIADRRSFVIEVFPERGRIKSPVLDFRQSDFAGVDVMHREKAGEPHASCGAGNESGHPVVAVDQVGFDRRNDVVEHFALERHCLLETVVGVTAVYCIPVVKDPVFSQMDPGTGVEVHHIGAQIFTDHIAQIHMEHAPVMGQRHMDIGAAAEEGAHQ